MQRYYDMLRIVMTLLLTLFVIGCATTPNKPYSGPGFPNGFSIISESNPTLALELQKLPELQDGISLSEHRALEILAQIYADNQASFDSVFVQMAATGIPRVRKYCTPLQAFYWLAEDNQADVIVDVLNNYSLDTLLDKSWKFYQVPEDKVAVLDDVIESLKNESMKEDYRARRKRLSDGMFRNEIVVAYKRNRSNFTEEGRATIERLIDKRWDEFGEVVDRLNSPALVDYYERKLFRYVHWSNLPQPSVSPRYIFMHNEGECVSITGFTVHCLGRAGYPARELRLAGHNAPFHAVCLFEDGGVKYVMDNGRPKPVGIFPYSALSGE